MRRTVRRSHHPKLDDRRFVNDAGAARHAGCQVVCVPYGYNHGHDIREARPDAVIDSIADLPRLLRGAD